MASNNRPMSPHLDIYRWRITMLTSTLHRLTGVVVSLGMFVLVIKLALFAGGGHDGFAASGKFANSFWFVWSLTVYYHLCNGIRHLAWDAGKGFDVPTAEKTAKWVLFGAVVLTLLTWVFVAF
ncbi:MAG: succinate dehydrogenase, cytochrome b556 subunit [Gammaproteobacteria bacterium]|nr:MAG: succinate dehydrogenase, cytochrome b556 subunit [Gammaproteobacteria bacterium]